MGREQERYAEWRALPALRELHLELDRSSPAPAVLIVKLRHIANVEAVAPEFERDMQIVGGVVAKLDLRLLRAERPTALSEMRLIEKRRVAVALVADVAAAHETEQRFGLDAMVMRGFCRRRRGGLLHPRLCVFVLVIVTVVMRTAVLVPMTIRMTLCRRGRRKCHGARHGERSDPKTHESPLFRGLAAACRLI
jgi:hypothetical protein